MSVLVIGLGGRSRTDDWAALLEGRTILARDLESAACALPTGASIARSFDHFFESPDISSVATRIASEVVAQAASLDVAYLVPGIGAIGDVTVAALSCLAAVDVAPGRLAPLEDLGAAILVVDALELAVAEAAEPFGGPLPLSDPATAALITNWRGDKVVRLAAQRVRRSYDDSISLEPSADGAVSIPARDVVEVERSIAALATIVARLRRDDGCPWDREQTPSSLLPALMEESDELRQAIEAGDRENTIEEIGDVLVNLLMQAQIASESGAFRFEDAVNAACRKLIRRHPHVFGGASAATSDDVLAIWHKVKAEESSARAEQARVAGAS